MVETTETIKLVIISAQPTQLAPVANFLGKRAFSVSIKSTLREGLNQIAKDKPDWVFVSLNLGPSLDKFSAIVKESFNIETIIFADTLDRNAMIRLEQIKGPVIHSKLTGPSIQLRLHQILFDRNPQAAAETRAASRATSGVRRSAFQQIKGDERSFGSVRINMGPVSPAKSGGVNIVQGTGATVGGRDSLAPPGGPSSFPPPAVQSPGESALSAHMKKISAELSTPATNGNYRAVENVDHLNVMVWEEHGVSGYLVVGGSLNAEESAAEAAKIQQQVGAETSATARFKEKFFGALKVKIDSLPDWASMRSNLVQRYITGVGEMLTCFIPEANPLPRMQLSEADKQRIEVRTLDIPTEVGLPCPIYIHLKENNRCVCLIKPEGHLSSIQQERLIKMGAENLHIANEDAHRFNLFYVRQKLNVA
jgi:hypothetical protein